MFQILCFQLVLSFDIDQWINEANMRIHVVGIVGCRESNLKPKFRRAEFVQLGCGNDCELVHRSLEKFLNVTGRFDAILVTDMDCQVGSFDVLQVLVRPSGPIVYEHTMKIVRRQFWIPTDAPPTIHTAVQHSSTGLRQSAYVSYASLGMKYDNCILQNRKWAVDRWKPISIAQFTPFDLSTEFRERAASILALGRGSGYWVWKPAVIWNQLSATNADFLIYTDACSTISSSVEEIVRNFPDSAFLFALQMQHPEAKWTKGDVLGTLNCDQHCQNSGQFNAAISIWKVKDSRSLDFVMRWSNYSLDPQLITDAPSRIANHQTFVDHRHDQSIYSIMIKQQLQLDPTSVFVLPEEGNIASHKWG